MVTAKKLAEIVEGDSVMEVDSIEEADEESGVWRLRPGGDLHAVGDRTRHRSEMPGLRLERDGSGLIGIKSAVHVRLESVLSVSSYEGTGGSVTSSIQNASTARPSSANSAGSLGLVR